MFVHRTFALFLLGTAATIGQPSAVPPVPVTPPGVPVPGVRPAPAGAPAAIPAEPVPQPGVPLGETKIITDINEPKLSGNALAGLYRKYTGHRVIVSAAASTAEFSFVQEASKQDPLTFAEAAELLRKAATIEDFIFVPDGEDPNLDFLTLASGGIRPTRRGVDVYNENRPLPDGDAVITYVMTLSYIKPAEAVNTFTQIIGTFGSYGSIAAVPNASAVVITENTSLIRKLIDLKTEIDKPGSVQGSRFIKVRYADVTEIAETLTQLLTAQQSAQKTAGIQRADAPAPGVPGAPGAQAGSHGGGTAGEDTPVQIVPDPRTNRIFAMGRPVDLIFVENLVREFDVETSEKNFLRRKLRFLTVSDFLPIAGDALTRAFSGTGTAGGGGGGGGGSQGGSRSQGGGGGRQASGSSRSAGSGSTGANFGSGSSSGSGSSFGSSSNGRGGSSSGSMGGGSGGGSSLSAPNVSSAPESILVGRTLLVADNITNSIVVQGPPSGLEIIEKLLNQIDVKPDQVMISTVIGQLTLDNSTETGLDYLFQGNQVSGRGGAGFGAILPILKYFPGSPGTPAIPAIPANPLTGTPLIPAVPAGPAIPAQSTPFAPGSLSGGGGLRAYGQVGNLNIYLKALQSKTDFTVLSRPSIFTSNNQKGTISSGEKIAIPTGSNTYGGGTGSNTSTQIQYQDVVLKLEVIPLVNSDNEITMQIALLNDEVNGTQTIQGGAGNGQDLSVPKISTREILTTATVPNNNTIVLGGLIISRGGKEKSGIPILGDIPYLGRLFSNTLDTTSRSELMVFIQPSIVSSDRSLNDVQADMDSRYKVSEKLHKMADGPGVAAPAAPVEVITDKSGKPLRPIPKATYDEAPSQSGMKPSIRPARRR